MVEETTVSLLADLTNELRDDDSGLKDATLVGTDGGRVSATKAVLAIRSQVFRKMFSGSFKEAREDCSVVNLDYPSVILRVVVEYCYTNKVNYEIIKGTNGPTDASAVMLVKLGFAMHYLGLLGTWNDGNYGGQSLFYFPSSACAVLPEIVSVEGLGKFYFYWIDYIVSNQGRTLFPSDPKRHAGVIGLPLHLLEAIVTNAKLDAAIAVRALQAWSATHEYTTEEERRSLQKLADGIDVESLKTSQLANIEPCAFFTQNRLYNALVAAIKKT